MLAIAFLGYAIGRLSDYINILIKDPIWIPHHWITGLVIATIGFFLLEGNLESYFIFFGLGLFTSDFKDFMELKFFAQDKKTKVDWKFWGVD